MPGFDNSTCDYIFETTNGVGPYPGWLQQSIKNLHYDYGVQSVRGPALIRKILYQVWYLGLYFWRAGPCPVSRWQCCIIETPVIIGRRYHLTSDLTKLVTCSVKRDCQTWMSNEETGVIISVRGFRLTLFCVFSAPTIDPTSLFTMSLSLY